MPDLRTHVPLRVEFEDFDVPARCAHRDKVLTADPDSSLHDTTTTVASILPTTSARAAGIVCLELKSLWVDAFFESTRLHATP